MKEITVTVKYDPCYEVMDLYEIPEEIKGDKQAIVDYAREHAFDFEVQESVDMYSEDDAVHPTQILIDINGKTFEDYDRNEIYIDSEDYPSIYKNENKDNVYCIYLQRKAYLDFYFELPDDVPFEAKRLVICGVGSDSYYYTGPLDEDGTVDYFGWKDEDVITLTKEYSDGGEEYLTSVFMEGEFNYVD